MIVHFLQIYAFFAWSQPIKNVSRVLRFTSLYAIFRAVPPKIVKSGFYCLHPIITFISLLLQDISHVFLKSMQSLKRKDFNFFNTHEPELFFI
jgi:hypothetical protein